MNYEEQSKKGVNYLMAKIPREELTLEEMRQNTETLSAVGNLFQEKFKASDQSGIFFMGQTATGRKRADGKKEHFFMNGTYIEPQHFFVLLEKTFFKTDEPDPNLALNLAKASFAAALSFLVEKNQIGFILEGMEIAVSKAKK